MKKGNLVYYLVLGVAFVVFNVLAFVIPTEKTATFWIAYAFTVLAFGCVLLLFKIGFNNNETRRSLFLKLPLLNVGLIYLVVQFVAFLIFMIVSSIPHWVAIVVCVLIAGVFIILLLPLNSAIEEIKQIDEKVKAKVSFIRILQVDVELLEQAENNAEVKSRLKRLAQDIRFSDPMSSPLLAPLEEKIVIKIDELKSSDSKMEIIEQITLLLIERNKKCKVLK